MCLAVPVKITKILESQRALANLGGIEKEISVALIDDIAVDDYVILHVGYALTKLDKHEAQKTLQLFKDMMQQAGDA